MSLRSRNLYMKFCLSACFLGSLAACAPDIHRMEDADSPAAGIVLLAQQMRSQGDEAGALNFYYRALERDPKDAVARADIAALLEKMGHPTEAAAQYEEALKLKPHNIDLRRGYGRVLIALGRPADARDQFARALEEKDDDPRALNGMGVALDQLGDHIKAQDYLRKALKKDPANLKTLNNLAFAHIQAGQPQEAIKLLEPVSREASAPAVLRQNLAYAYGLAGMDVDAERLARLDLTPAQVKNNLAFFKQKRAELGLRAPPFAELGSFPTQGMAEAQADKALAHPLLKGKKISIVPEIKTAGGIPSFSLRVTAPAEKLEGLCKDLGDAGFTCRVRSDS